MNSRFDFKTGDLVKVSQKIREGKKERLISYQGMVVRVKGSGDNQTFTLRQHLEGIEVERILPASLPSLESVKVMQSAKKSFGKLRVSKKDKIIV